MGEWVSVLASRSRDSDKGNEATGAIETFPAFPFADFLSLRVFNVLRVFLFPATDGQPFDEGVGVSMVWSSGTHAY